MVKIVVDGMQALVGRIIGVGCGCRDKGRKLSWKVTALSARDGLDRVNLPERVMGSALIKLPACDHYPTKDACYNTKENITRGRRYPNTKVVK